MLTIIQTHKERYVLIKNNDLYIIRITQAWISGTTETYKAVKITEVLFDDEVIKGEATHRTYLDALSSDKILNKLSHELIKRGSICKRKYKGGYNVC